MGQLENERDRNADQWLESELCGYAKVDARTGLEGRVLANLEAERRRLSARTRWWWAFGTATALAALALMVWIGPNSHGRNLRSIARSSKVPSTAAASTTHREESQESIQAMPSVADRTGGIPARAAKSVPAPLPTDQLPAQRTPKLEQFPSRRNLSQEESLLVRRLSEQFKKEALIGATTTHADADLSIDSLEIRPLQIPDIEISESKIN